MCVLTVVFVYWRKKINDYTQEKRQDMCFNYDNYMNVLEIIILVYSKNFLHLFTSCCQARINFNTSVNFRILISFLPKQYADEQISKGVSSYTKNVPQFFILIKWLLEQVLPKFTWHSLTILISPFVSGMSSIRITKNIHWCSKEKVKLWKTAYEI